MSPYCNWPGPETKAPGLPPGTTTSPPYSLMSASRTGLEPRLFSENVFVHPRCAVHVPGVATSGLGAASFLASGVDLLEQTAQQTVREHVLRFAALTEHGESRTRRAATRGQHRNVWRVEIGRAHV